MKRRPGSARGLRRGRWTLQGDGPIAIERDAAGVPHIRASTEADLYRGLGSCHAKDRALQLVLTRVIGQGRAAEVLDPSDAAVEGDRFLRRVNLGAGAETEVAKLTPRHRSLLEAYSEGINGVLARRRPWELRLIRHRPEPWTPSDCLLVGRLVGFAGLAQTQGEMERVLVQLVQAGVSRPLLEELFRAGLGALDEELVRSVSVGERVIPERLAFSSLVPAAAASNNWAIAPSRTASGSALLANDPHLPVDRLPAVWYEAVIEQGGRWCAAAGMPGLPFPVIGRTGDAAWGVTYAYADATDSWVEECRDGRHLRVVDGEERWEPFRERTEVILRKGGEPVTAVFHENGHGVLEGDPREPGRYLSTRWSGGGETGAASLGAVLDLLHAESAAAAGELLARVEWSLNWMLADRHGSIGYRMSGRVPLRASPEAGLVPLAGWDPANDWRGFVAPEDLPQSFDPPEGFLVTANNDLNHLGRERPINLSGPPYRAARIAERLSERDDWTREAAGQVQMDLVSHHALRYLEVLRPLLADDPRFAPVIEWDGEYGDRSAPAAWFDAFFGALAAAVLGRVCGPEPARFLLDETSLFAHFFHHLDEVLLDAGSGWYAEDGRDAAFRRAAEAALPVLSRAPGPRQEIVLGHLLLAGKLPRRLGFDRGPVPLHGGRATVHQGQLVRGAGRNGSIGPSYRLVVDFGEPGSLTALPGGPSDRRFSRWYASGVDDWVAGRLKPLRPR